MNTPFPRKDFWRESGLAVALHRKRKRLTQAELAREVGISRNGVANIENGRQSTALDVAWRVSIVLGVPLTALCPLRRQEAK